MIEGLLSAATTFFATIGPVEAAVLFATLTPKMDRDARRAVAAKATVIAGVILLIFTLLGEPLLRQLGVSIAALQTAGGIILLLIALDMVFAKPGSAFKLTPSEGAEAQSKDEIAVFPLATPLLAGPGAMSSAILLAANAHGDPLRLRLTRARGCVGAFGHEALQVESGRESAVRRPLFKRAAGSPEGAFSRGASRPCRLDAARWRGIAVLLPRQGAAGPAFYPAAWFSCAADTGARDNANLTARGCRDTPH